MQYIDALYKPEYKKIVTGKQEVGKDQSVFVVFYCDDATPYKKYKQVSYDKRGSVIPLVLMQMRWDGKIGFPGGKVDYDESLVEAACREVYEEINSSCNPDLLIPLSTYATDTMNIHSFAYKVDERCIKDMIVDAADADHFGTENCGCFVVQIAHYEKDKGFPNFIYHNFCATAGMELADLIQKYDLLKEI